MSKLAHRGFTLLELLISITIGLFLIGGLLTLTSAMKASSGMQSNLTQVQDSERLAMGLMTDVIQQAGYYPSPVTTTAVTAFPLISGPSTWTAGAPSGATLPAGYSIVGAPNALTTAGDSITVRYNTSGSDNLMNCAGGYSSGTAAAFINTFQVGYNSGTGTYSLNCILTTIGTATTSTTIQLVSGVQYMSVRYGVQSNAVSGTSSIDCYLTAAAVSANSLWNAVRSVQITLGLANPLYGTLPGQTKTVPQFIVFVRTIDLMNTVGIITGTPT